MGGLSKGLDMASAGMAQMEELKRQKDEMQIAMMEKGISPLWGPYDPEDKGYITQAQLCDLAKAALEALGKVEFYNELVFTTVCE